MQNDETWAVAAERKVAKVIADFILNGLILGLEGEVSWSTLCVLDIGF